MSLDENTPNHTAPQSLKTAESKCCNQHAVKLTALGSSIHFVTGVKTDIRILQMDCPTEERLIRAKLASLTGIVSLEFKLLSRVLTVVHEAAALDNILRAIKSLGYTPEIGFTDAAIAAQPSKPKYLSLSLAAIIAFASVALVWLSVIPSWLSAVLALIAILICGLGTYKKGWMSLVNVELNINALMSIAVTGAFLIGQWPEAAMVMVLFSVAERIEQNALQKAENAIKGLLELTPALTTVQQEEGRWQSIATNQVTQNSRVRVNPGQRISLDGVIVKGIATVDQAPITGESLVVDKKVGDKVYAGTINGVSAFEFKVSAINEETTLAAIIKVVEQAQSNQAPIQRFIDKFSGIYTPIVLAIAVVVAMLGPFMFEGDWLEWIYKALVLLVIACPCALVISTPVTVVSGLTAAARRGILIKGGVYLERARHISWLALDKTGTVTSGKPALVDYLEMTSGTRLRLKQLALSLSQQSDHPVSNAISQALVKAGYQVQNVDNFEALLGAGIRGEIASQIYYMGNTALAASLNIISLEQLNRLKNYEEQGKTLTLLMSQKHILAMFAVADRVKQSSTQAIADLHSLNVRTMILSGDNQPTVDAVAKHVGVDHGFGQLLPADKLEKIQQLQETSLVAMVGDGINDSPALAKSDIGFAMGALGTDLAIETADVVLMDDNLAKIPMFIRLSHKTRRILVQNICFSITLKVLFLTITIAGYGDMWMAVFADVGASLIVVANGLRLLKIQF